MVELIPVCLQSGAVAACCGQGRVSPVAALSPPACHGRRSQSAGPLCAHPESNTAIHDGNTDHLSGYTSREEKEMTRWSAASNSVYTQTCDVGNPILTFLRLA